MEGPVFVSPVRLTRVAPFTGLCAAAELTIPRIPIFAEQAARELVLVAECAGIEVVGPMVFVYTAGSSPAESSPGTGQFLLHVVLPVPEGTPPPNTPGESPAKIAVKVFAELDCACLDYKGPLGRIGEAYPYLVEEVERLGHQPLTESREIYRECTDYDSPDNITEIQLGIRRRGSSRT